MHPTLFLLHVSAYRHADAEFGPWARYGLAGEGRAARASEARRNTPPAQEKTPFYKRKLSLRSRKHDQPAVGALQPLDVDAELGSDPFAPRGVGFVYAADVDPADESETAEPDTPATQPAEHEVPPLASSDDVDRRVALGPFEEPVGVEPTEVVEPDEAVAYWNDQGATDRRASAAAPPLEQLADPPDEAGAERANVDTPAPFDAADDDPPPFAEGDDTPGLDDDESAVPAVEKPSKRNRRAVRSRRSSTSSVKKASPRAARGTRRVVGLKVGASQLAAAVVGAQDGRHELLQLARMPLEPGIISDGEVRDPEALSHALKSFFDENKLPRRDVRIGIASNRIGVRTFDIVGIDDQARFDNAVRFKAHEVLPVSVHESVLDYRVIDERVTESGEVVRRVLLVVAPRDQVEPFITACRAAGVRLAGFDLEALGLLRTFVEPQRFALRNPTDTATVVVSIGHEATTLLVAGAGAAEFTRVFDWGGGVLQQAIAQELDVQPAEAATILKGLSLSGPGSSQLDGVQRTLALDAVRARLTPFARELVSSLQFYQSQPESLGIGELLITGGTSHLEGLAEALNQMIGVAVRIGDPLARVVASGPIDPAIEATLGSMSVPIGLAIEDEALRSVNLLPPELRQTGRKWPSPLAVAVPLAVVVPIAALGFLFMQASGDVSDRQRQLGSIELQIAALPEPKSPQIDASLEAAQQQRAAALATVLGTRLAWDSVLVDLSRVLPANVWLTKFTAKSSGVDPSVPTEVAAPGTTGAAAPVPTGVTIDGYTFSHPDVARLLARLATLPSLTNVALSRTERSEIGSKPAVSFSILADLNQSGGTP